MCSSSYHLGSLGFYRDCVAGELADEDKPFEPNFSDAADCVFPDVHIASACLQKALRRGDARFALAAGEMLRISDPERLWRRLCVCAFEDFGLVDLGDHRAGDSGCGEQGVSDGAGRRAGAAFI